MEPNRIETRRLILEPLRLEHADLCLQSLQDPSLYEFVPQDPPRSSAELMARYRELLEGSGSTDAIWLNWFGRKRDSALYVCYVQATVALSAKTCYLAYQTFSPYRRTGLAKEACSGVLAHVARSYGVRGGKAECDARNLASRGLLISLGFSEGAYRHGADHFKGAQSDEVTYLKTFDLP